MSFDRLHAYFRSKGFEPFAFQSLAWERTANRVHQLIQCPTGSGKTLAATGAMIEKLLANPDNPRIIVGHFVVTQISGTIWLLGIDRRR